MEVDFFHYSTYLEMENYFRVENLKQKEKNIKQSMAGKIFRNILLAIFIF